MKRMSGLQPSFCFVVTSRMGARIEMLCGAFRYDYIMPPVRQKA